MDPNPQWSGSVYVLVGALALIVSICGPANTTTGIRTATITGSGDNNNNHYCRVLTTCLLTNGGRQYFLWNWSRSTWRSDISTADMHHRPRSHSWVCPEQTGIHQPEVDCNYFPASRGLNRNANNATSLHFVYYLPTNDTTEVTCYTCLGRRCFKLDLEIYSELLSANRKCCTNSYSRNKYA